MQGSLHLELKTWTGLPKTTVGSRRPKTKGSKLEVTGRQTYLRKQGSVLPWLPFTEIATLQLP